MDLDGLNVFLVGGNTGIAKATTERLQEAGASVSVGVRDSTGVDVPNQAFEATDPEPDLDLPEALDALIYCPGTIQLKPFHRLSLDHFLQDMEVNLFGAVRVIQAALPALKKAPSGNASICLFSSVAASTGMPFHASIAAAKAAVEGLTRSLAAVLSPGIRVNAIAPSLTDTPLAAQFLGSDTAREAAEKRHPLNQIGDPKQVANLLAFLVSPSAQFITGQVIRADGGLSTLRKF